MQIGSLQARSLRQRSLSLLQLDFGAESDVRGRFGRDAELAPLERGVRVGRVGQPERAASGADRGRCMLGIGLLERARDGRRQGRKRQAPVEYRDARARPNAVNAEQSVDAVCLEPNFPGFFVRIERKACASALTAIELRQGVAELDEQRGLRRFSKSSSQIDAIDEQIEEAMKLGEGFGERAYGTRPNDDIYRSHSVDRIVGTGAQKRHFSEAFAEEWTVDTKGG